AGGEAEPVEREEPAAVGGEEGDRLDDVVGLGVVHGVVEADAAPARLDAVGALADGVPVAVAQLPADAEEAVAVRPGARAPRAALDPEEVVQQDGDELGMEAAAVAVAEVERDDADALRGVGRAEDLDPLVAAPPRERARQQRVLARLEGVEAEGPLELQRQRGAEDLEHA